MTVGCVYESYFHCGITMSRYFKGTASVTNQLYPCGFIYIPTCMVSFIYLWFPYGFIYIPIVSIWFHLYTYSFHMVSFIYLWLPYGFIYIPIVSIWFHLYTYSFPYGFIYIPMASLWFHLYLRFLNEVPNHNEF